MKSEAPRKERPKKTRSFAGVVRERLAEIEKKMAQGFTHEGIRQELMAEGFEASLQSFSSTLARARQRKKASPKPPDGAGPAASNSRRDFRSRRRPVASEAVQSSLMRRQALRRIQSRAMPVGVTRTISPP